MSERQTEYQAHPAPTDDDEFILPPDPDAIAEAMSAGPAPTRRKPNPLAAEVARLTADRDAAVAEMAEWVNRAEERQREREAARDTAVQLGQRLNAILPVARAIVRYFQDAAPPTGLTWPLVEAAYDALPDVLRAELGREAGDATGQ